MRPVVKLEVSPFTVSPSASAFTASRVATNKIFISQLVTQLVILPPFGYLK